MALTQDRLFEMRGQEMMDRDGDKIGKVEEIYLDAETDAPEWALVSTGLFGTKSTFVPLREATEEDGALRVPYEKAMIKDAPKVESDGELSQGEESELYAYYGLDYSERRSDTGLPEGTAGTTGGEPVGRDVGGSTTDDAMTRSEEELRVGTAQRETGRARLRKYVVTEEVQQTVPVQREEVRVEREPITDANVDSATSGPEISEEEHEVTLHAEEPVVEKRAVPKERVRLDKETVTEERGISEDVRREEIDVEGTDETERRDRGA